MKFVGYEERYGQDLLHFLKRNVSRFRRFTDEELFRWLRPILDYPWLNRIDPERYPYRRGLLLLDEDERVCGFSGAIYSRRNIGGQQRTVVSPSLMLTDPCYKYYFFEMNDMLVASADVTYDVTPNDKAVATDRTLYGAAIFDNPSYLFAPAAVPTGGFCLSASADEHSLAVLRDHQGCGLECVHIAGRDDGTDVFFNRIYEVGYRPMHAVCVLEVSNPAFFRRNFAVCAWLLSGMGKEYLTTDSRYVAPTQLPEPYGTCRRQIAVINSPVPEAYSFLYTEFVLLTRDCYW